MKRQALLLIAGGLMALASCQSETTTTTNEMSQAQIDSTVNARVEEMRMQMMASNDSLINEMALYKADSMCAAMKGQAPKPRTSARKSNGSSVLGSGTSTPVSNEPVNSKEGRFNGTGSGKNKEERFNQTEAGKAQSAQSKEEKMRNR